ncbi:MAG: T9SS type A sorting domain-containing protein [Bacteroidetes bacterium]|nr:T9SS type A sorting domain-containing protein [Bacteroidota bacterium]
MSPNPADDLVTISVEDIKQGSLKSKNPDTFKNEYEVTVYNNLQVKIYHLKTNEPSIQIDTKNLASGVYSVHITPKGKEKIVKQLIVTH